MHRESDSGSLARTRLDPVAEGGNGHRVDIEGMPEHWTVARVRRSGDLLTHPVQR